MLNDVQFKQFCYEREFSEGTNKLINEIRESEPSRGVVSRGKNVIGAYPSKKMGQTIQFESHTIELPAVVFNEYDENVLEMYDQPPAIKLTYNSLKGKVVGIFYTPSFFVIKKDGAGWEEWRSEEYLLKQAQDSPERYVLKDGQWHCPPGELYAQQFGLHYWLKSSSQVNTQLYRNIKFLEDYWLDKKAKLLVELIKKVTSIVRSEPGILLINLLGTSGVEADDINLMIANGELYVDLEEQLLCEPEFTNVFIDEQTSIAYKTMTSRKSIPILENHSIVVAPGTKVAWEGNPWTIVNTGENGISLISAEKQYIELPKDCFFNLVCENKIKGIDDDILKATNLAANSIIAEAKEEELAEANRRYEMIMPLLEGAKLRDIENNINVTTRTIRNWLKSYYDAEQIYGAGYLGLIPCINKRGNRTDHLPAMSLKEANTFIEKSETIVNQSNKVLYGKFKLLCEEKGFIAPSLKTFSKLIKKRSKHIRTQNTEGSRAAYQHEPFWNLEMSTPRHGDRPFELAHIDHTEIDLETNHSKTGKNLGRLWLTIMIDAYTRRVLAFYLTFDKPSYRSNMMVLRECVRRFNRLPQEIITDNGGDFKSTYYQSLLALYKVTRKLRPPHKSRVGSVMERIFGTVTSQIIHNLEGNTKMTKNVRMVTKSVNPKNNAVWTLPALYELLQKYFYEFYDTNEHSSLGESPREAFQRGLQLSGKREFRFIPYDREFLIMTLPRVKNGIAKVDSQRGVKVNYQYYRCNELTKAGIAGTSVPARYDPWNMGVVYCFVNGHWVECYSEYYSIFKGRTESEIKVASVELLKQKQKMGESASLSAKELASFLASNAEVNQELLKQRLNDSEMELQLSVIQGGLEINKKGPNTVSKEQDPVVDEAINFDLDEDSVL